MTISHPRNYFLNMKAVKQKLLKTNIKDFIVSQGIMGDLDAVSMIRQGRIRINRQIYFDPKHGIRPQPGCSFVNWMQWILIFVNQSDVGTPFTIDKTQWFWFPQLYIIRNKPAYEPEEDALNAFPSCFRDRDDAEIQGLLTLPQNMSGLTVYTDDSLLIKQWHALRKSETTVEHRFEVC